MNNYLDKIRAERIAWAEAYKNASEDEKKVMLEERAKTRKEREEKERKMREDFQKQKFIEISDEQIGIYYELETGIEIVKEFVKKFDGKVLNNRLTKAVEKELPNASRFLAISLEYVQNYSAGKNDAYLTLIRCYSGNKDCRTKIKILFDNDGRILADKTLAEFEDVIPTKIANYEKAKEDYDIALEEARILDKKIEEFVKKYHHSLREYLNNNYVLQNKHYL